MSDLGVASCTLDVVSGDMEVVDERRVRVTLELLRLVVTGEAALARRFAVPLDDIQVALLTGDAAARDLFMVEPDRAHDNVAFRGLVAARASGDRGEFPSGVNPFEVEEEEGGRRTH